MEFNEQLESKLKDKNSQNFYPLSSLSLTLRKTSNLLLETILYVFLFSYAFEYIFKPLIEIILDSLNSIFVSTFSILDIKISNNWGESFSKISLINLSKDLSLYLGTIFLITLIIYLVLVFIRKTKYYEFDILKNDGLSLKFKKRLLYKTRFNVDFKNKISDIQDINEKRKKKKIAKLIKKLVIQINSRMSIDEEGFFREFVLKIKRDNETKVNEELENVINDLRFSQALHEIAEETLHESIAFSNLVNLEREYRIYATKGYSKEYLKNKLKLEFEEDKENEKTFHFSMPLALIEEDSSAIIAQKKKDVLKWAKSFEKNISFTMNTSKERATLDEIMAGDTSVIYVYTLPQNASINISTLEQNIQNNTKMKGIVAKLEAGVLQISVPVPDKLTVPVDFVTLLEDTFGKAE